jgi:hypothetical protein
MPKLRLITTLLAVIAAAVFVGLAVAAAIAGPTDLSNNHDSGNTAALASDLTYRASLFPIAITFRSTDGLWGGAQNVRTAEGR